MFITRGNDPIRQVLQAQRALMEGTEDSLPDRKSPVRPPNVQPKRTLRAMGEKPNPRKRAPIYSIGIGITADGPETPAQKAGNAIRRLGRKPEEHMADAKDRAVAKQTAIQNYSKMPAVRRGKAPPRAQRLNQRINREPGADVGRMTQGRRAQARTTAAIAAMKARRAPK